MEKSRFPDLQREIRASAESLIYTANQICRKSLVQKQKCKLEFLKIHIIFFPFRPPPQHAEDSPYISGDGGGEMFKMYIIFFFLLKQYDLHSVNNYQLCSLRTYMWDFQ